MLENIPPPSWLVFLSEMREGEVTAIRETTVLTAGLLADHPELTVSDEAAPGFYRSNFLANRAEKAAAFAAPLGFLILVAAILLRAARRRLGAPLEKLL